MIVKERRTVWYFRSWESMSTYSTMLLTQLVTELTIGSTGKSSTTHSSHDVLSLVYNLKSCLGTIPSTVVTYIQLPVTHPLPLAVILPTSPLLLSPSLVDYVSVHPTWLVHVLSMLYVVSFPDSQCGTEGLTEGLGMRLCWWYIIVMDLASVFCITYICGYILWDTFSANTSSSSCSIMVECSLVSRPPFNPLEGSLGTRLGRMLIPRRSQ